MPKLESPGLQAEEHIIKHDRRSEILVEIEALVLDRLFGPGPWFLAHREAVVQLRERILKWGLEEPVPGKKDTWRATALGRELNVDLLYFLGLWRERDMALTLKEYGFIDDREVDHILRLLDEGRDFELVLKKYVIDAYRRWHVMGTVLAPSRCQ